MLGGAARRIAVGCALLASGCTPELGDVPFACETGGLCPEGYSCQATVCVRDGVSPIARRPIRVQWINPAEMFWIASKDGGASLLVNDGFTPDEKGIYEIRVSPDGVVSEPRALYLYGDGPTISSSVFALPDGRYGVALVRFPNIDGNVTTLDLIAIERDTPAGTTPAIENLFTKTTPYLGGVEPPYVAAVLDGTTLNIAWTVPSDGGQTEVLHLERQGSLWNPTWTAKTQLPNEILPLSGDCQLFRADDGFLTLRVGFESYALTNIDAMGTIAPFKSVTDEPLFGWKEGVFAMRRGDYDVSAATYAISFPFLDPAGAVVSEDTGFILGDTASPFVGTSFEGGTLIAPISRDVAMPTIDVGWRSPTEPLRIVASVPRASTEPLYTARAFGAGDVAYIAWTEFHESSMDLWVGVSPLQREGRAP
jgi:hypothetical protein